MPPARMPGEGLKGPIVGDFQSLAEVREHLYQRCQNRCKTRACAKELVCVIAFQSFNISIRYR